MWFAENIGSQIGRATTAGAFAEYAAPARSYPDAIANGPDGALWFVGRHLIGHATTAASVIAFGAPDARTNASGAIVAGPDGTLSFTERSAGKIARIVSP